MADRDREIESLLQSVAGGGSVDWDAETARAGGGEERTRIEALRDVARLADFHRVLQRDAGAPSPGPREIERWGDLLLLERVGAGASADVYRVWDPALQREMALKLLRPGVGEDAAADWLEEARALARIRDVHVVAVHGAGEHDGRAGLWMEFLRGPTLEAEIARRGALGADETARLGVQLAQALTAVHAAGALHRDVKPANIILERDGRAVLTDFGLGRRRVRDNDPRSLSGSPLFMSPERLAGASATTSDDLYSLGVTLWCALAGKEPFRAANLTELRAAVAAGPARSLRTERPDAPAALTSAIERAMHRDAATRFGSAPELTQALERTVRAPASRGRAVPALWVLAVLVVALAGGAFWGSQRPRAASPVSPAAPPAVAPAIYDITATFLRRDAAGDTRLSSGDRVRPGDRLSLELRSTRRVWVYVLDSDEHGETYLLFPQPLFDRRNPLPADSTVVLPGTRTGRESAWTVTSRGGREHLMIVTHPEPLSELEAELARLPAPSPDRPVSYARVSQGAMDRLRGIGGVSDAPVREAPSRPTDAFERIRALAGAERGVRGTWVRQIVLENPR